MFKPKSQQCELSAKERKRNAIKFVTSRCSAALETNQSRHPKNHYDPMW